MGFGNGEWDFGTGVVSGEKLASKDRAESPARSERPKERQRTNGKGLKFIECDNG